MQVSVHHVTEYRYSGDVSLAPHTLRLRPRHDGGQILHAFQLKLDPEPVGSNQSLDQDGNVVTHAWFTGLHRSLIIQTDFEVETIRHNPFDFILNDNGTLRLPVQYPAAIRAFLAPYADVAQVTGQVRDFVDPIAERTGRQTLPFLSALNQAMYEEFGHERRDRGAPWRASETLAARGGSCRDLAVLFCDACRSFGLASRFVSGYSVNGASCDQTDMHAWAEVYLPGGGWRGFDPAAGLAVAAGHIAVAAAGESSLATPVSGNYGGAHESHMDAAIYVTIG